MTTKTKRKTKTKLENLLGTMPTLREDDNTLTDKVNLRRFLGNDCDYIKAVAFSVEAVETDSPGYSGQFNICDGTQTASMYFSHYDHDDYDTAMEQVEELYYMIKQFKDAMQEAKAAFNMKNKVMNK